MKLLSIFLCLFLLTGCSHAPIDDSVPTSVPVISDEPVAVPETEPPTTEAPDPIRELLNTMSLEERVGQLFLARCDNSVALQHVKDYHLGGFLLFGVDIKNETPDSLHSKVDGYQAAADLPLLIAVDEEGGTVTRVSRYPAFRSKPFSAPREYFEKQGYDAVLAAETEKAQLLSSLGINTNLGPVCDITTEPSAFMYQRSFGQAPAITGRFVMDTVQIMAEHQIGSCLKHFPGYGKNTDTHTAIARDTRTLKELEEIDLVPFRSGISAGCDAILVSHTFIDALDSQLPASLSPAVHDYLRQEMGFDGVIVTDDLVMQAITDLYGAGEAAVMAVLAGNDLLCSTDYMVQYEAVLAAILEGRIDIDTLNNAVRNVLEWKMELGLM